MSECNCVDTGHKQDCPLGKDLRIAAMQEQIAILQSDLAAARAELARAKPALIKAWEIFFTRSFSQDPIGRAEARYAREIAQEEQPSKNTGSVIHDFWELRLSQRRKIMADLGLIEDSDMTTPELARYNAAFLKANERGLLDQVATKVAAHKGEEG